MDDFDLDAFGILIEKLEAIAQSVIAQAPAILAGMILLLLTWLTARLARLGLRRGFAHSSMRPALQAALLTLITSLIWIFGVFVALMIALPGFTPSELLAGLGIGSLAIGLAFKDIFENFLAGLLIMLRKPMRIGDYIECEGIGGEVKRIRIRDTYLRRTDGVLVMLPNAFLYKNPVRVLTDRERRRQRLLVGVAYGESVAESREVIETAIRDLETVSDEHPIQVFAKDFGASSIDFEVVWWTGSKPVDIRRSRDEVVEAIKTALDDAGIEIPFPYRTLTFKEPLTLVDRRSDQKEAKA